MYIRRDFFQAIAAPTLTCAEGTNYGRFVFGIIQPYDLLEFTNSFADKHVNIFPAPFDIPIPDHIFYQLIFTENNGKTTLSMTGQPIDAIVEQVTDFGAINANMQEGFSASFVQLANYLSKT